MNKDILNLQKALSALGFDPGPLDGKEGVRTRQAAAEFSKGGTPSPAEVESELPLPNVAVDPDLKLNGVKTPLALLVLEAAKISETPFVVNEGLRSTARQAQLVKQGASKTMDSRHITGDAVDLWPLGADGKKLPSDAAFPRGSAQAKAADKALWDGLRNIAKAMKAASAKLGTPVIWGGDWKSFPDGPHFELKRK